MKIKSIAAYYRISAEDFDLKTRVGKDESNSITSQRQMIFAFLSSHAELAQMPVLEFFDDGYSGTNFDRPQFKAMFDRVKSGEISCIVVKDLSRFGRDYLAVGDYLDHIFPFLGLRFISINDGYDSADYSGKTSGMDMAFRNLIYDSYSKDLSRKVKSAMWMRMEKGKYVTHPPYGYRKSPIDKHQMVPDPGSSPTVQHIFSMSIEGKSTAAIATVLNCDGIPSPAEYKQHHLKEKSLPKKTLMWTHRTVLTILQNVKYTGTMVNHTRESRQIRDKTQRRVPPEEWMVLENAHEALVSLADFELVQQGLRTPQKCVKRPSDQPRVFYCGHCGRKLRITHGLDTYYSCDTPTYWNDAPCSTIRWNKTALEETLLAAFRGQVTLMQSEAVESKKITNPALALIAEIKVLAKQIAAYDDEKILLYEAYRDGSVPKADYLTRKIKMVAGHEDSQQKLVVAERKLQMLQAGHTATHPVATLHLQNMSEPVLLEKMYQAIDRVLVWSNSSIEIVWAFEDPFRQEHTTVNTA